jgi:Flp pilus assembly protein TadG
LSPPAAGGLRAEEKTMMRLRAPRGSRRGSVLPLTAILVVFLFALVALAVDLGWIMAVDTQMQSAADAAALAGTAKLLDPSALAGTANTGPACDTAMANARLAAQSFAHQNSAGNVALTLDANTSNASGGDIVCGYLANPSDQSATMIPTTPGVGPDYPNSVQVTVHRDATRNGSLALFFAPVLGIRTFDLQATSTATYEGGIRGFRLHVPGTTTIKLLPFALDVNVWRNLLQGIGSDGQPAPDNFTRSVDASGNPTVSPGGDGIPETKLFPLSNGNGTGQSGLPPGNFGTIDLGAPNNSTADLSRQIRYGVNATDLSYFPNNTIQLDSTTGTLDVNGDTGVSAGCKDDLISIIAQPRVIPLYSKVSGPGNNATYTICGFAGITITEVVLTGSLRGKHITIQPCWVVEPNALSGGPNTSTYVVKPLALTR